MKAAQLIDFGAADNFRIVDVARPEPRPDEILVKVDYAGLRWGDVLFGSVAGTGVLNPYEYSYDSITVLPFSMIPFFGTPAMRRAAAFTAEWLQTEVLMPPTVHPLEDVADVHRAMEAGETVGKVVFRP